MPKATPELKEFARRLLSLETGAGSPGPSMSPAFRASEKLRVPLAKLVGIGGFGSLLKRALVLAGAEVEWLSALHVNGDGSLEGLEEIEAKLGKDEIVVGEIALCAHLLGLLVTFIGPALTLAMVQEVWPKAPFGDLSF